MSDRICVGAIAGAFGVRGEVRLKSFCAVPEAIADYGPLSTEKDTQSFDITLTRPIKAGLAARLSGVNSKEAADALKGTRLYAPREKLPQLPDDEFYYSDLIGLTVADTGGVELGRVKAVLNYPAGDILEVKVKSGAVTLVPFTRDIVPTVDLKVGRMIVDPPEGLFDGN